MVIFVSKTFISKPLLVLLVSESAFNDFRERARQEYGRRGDLPAVTLTWYNGGAYPAFVKGKGIPQWGSAVLFMGSDGMLIADYGRHQLLPEDTFAGFKPPERFIADSIGHHREWVEACKGGEPGRSNFNFAAPLTETVLLGVIAVRTRKRLEWDSKNLRITNEPEANRYVHKKYREGWSL